MTPFIYTSAATFSIKKYFASAAEAIAWGNEHFSFFQVPYRLYTQSADWQWREITDR